MQDLNDFYVFSLVVERNGFAGAAKAMGVARSSVCRRVSNLEEKLGVRLIQRTTRQFAVTELGMELHGHCVKILAEANAAYERMACARKTPSGVIRVSCPAIIGQLVLAPLIPQYVEQHPRVRIALQATNRRVDIEEFDLCIRVRQIPSEDSGLFMRSLGVIQQVLVASPAFLQRNGRPSCPADVEQKPTIAYGSVQGPHVWKLVDPQEQQIQIRHEPTLIADDLLMIRQAALNGLGIAQLPLTACAAEIRAGQLEVVLPDFLAPLCEIQVVFPSRRGMLPAVRSFIDFLSSHCVNEVPERQMKRQVRFWTTRKPLTATSAPEDRR